MTDKISTRTPELERRLEYAMRIRKAFGYEGTADHEDVQSILRKFQEEITKEFADRIVEQLEELAEDARIEDYCPDSKWRDGCIENCQLCYVFASIKIVKGGTE